MQLFSLTLTFCKNANKLEEDVFRFYFRIVCREIMKKYLTWLGCGFHSIKEKKICKFSSS